ncbi:MAG TPA: ester cyclase [Thermoanaerobaculia bacterium]|nr:ester cyclase [Thermoanaerobaculia bacterium]
MTPLEENKAIVRKLINEGQSNGRLEVVDEMLAPDFVDHTPLEGLPGTREGVRMLFAALREAFPDLEVEISEQIAESDKVVTRKTFRGTHGGPFLGVPATGASVRFEVIDILTVRDRRICEHRVVVDKLGLLRQLGAIAA